MEAGTSHMPVEGTASVSFEEEQQSIAQAMTSQTPMEEIAAVAISEEEQTFTVKETAGVPFPVVQVQKDTKAPHQDKKPFITYIQNVSDVKKSKNNYSYFNFKLQTESNVLHGVCFEPTLQKTMSSKEETQRAIQISNYNLKRQSNDNLDSIVVNKSTKFDNVLHCKFDYNTINDSLVKKIDAVKLIPDFTMVTIVGQVNITSDPEYIEVNGKRLKKLEAKIADESDSISVTFWEEQIDKVTNQLSYNITNARVRTFQGNKCLSLNQESKISNVLPILNVAPSLFENNSSIDSIEVEDIDTMAEICRFFNCKNCSKKLQPCQGKVQQCNVCGMKQIIKKTDEENLSVIITLKDKKLSVTLFKDQIKNLIAIYNNENTENYDISTANDNDLTEIILCTNNVKVSFNKHTKIVTDIQKI